MKRRIWVHPLLAVLLIAPTLWGCPSRPPGDIRECKQSGKEKYIVKYNGEFIGMFEEMVLTGSTATFKRGIMSTLFQDWQREGIFADLSVYEIVMVGGEGGSRELQGLHLFTDTLPVGRAQLVTSSDNKACLVVKQISVEPGEVSPLDGVSTL